MLARPVTLAKPFQQLGQMTMHVGVSRRDLECRPVGAYGFFQLAKRFQDDAQAVPAAGVP